MIAQCPRSTPSGPAPARTLAAAVAIACLFLSLTSTCALSGEVCRPLPHAAAPAVGPNPLGVTGQPLDSNDNVADAAGTGQLFERVEIPGVTDVTRLDAATGGSDPAGADSKGSGGISVLDLNGDDFLDLVLQYDKVGSGSSANGFLPGLTHFMLNNGCGRFTAAAHTFGPTSGPDALPLPPDAQANASVPFFADFNGDGWPDIYLTRSRGRNSLYLNVGDTNGNGKVDDFDYEDHAVSMGVANAGAYNRQAMIGDVNGDGFLDIAVAADQIANRTSLGRPYQRLYVYQPPAGGANSPSTWATGRFADRAGPTSDPGKTAATAANHNDYERPLSYNPCFGLVPGWGGSRPASTSNAGFSPAPNPAFSRLNPGNCNTAVDRAGPRLLLRDLDDDGDLDLLQTFHADMNIRTPTGLWAGFGGTQSPQILADSTCSPINWRIGVFVWENRIAEPGIGTFVERQEGDGPYPAGTGLVDQGTLSYVDPANPSVRGTAPNGIFSAGTVPDGDAPSLAYANAADLDNDGRLDVIAVGDTLPITHGQSAAVAGRFWTNDGGFRFHEATAAAGLNSLNWTYDQWGAFFDYRFPVTSKVSQAACESSLQQGAVPGTGTDRIMCKSPGFTLRDMQIYGGDTVFGDFDNDGWLDMLLVDRREIDGAWGELRNVLYLNDGQGRLEPQTTRISGIDSNSVAAETGDLNSDGLLDLVFLADPLNTYTLESQSTDPVTLGPDPPPDRFKDKLYINTGVIRDASNNHWVRLRLIGAPEARAIGARVLLRDAIDGSLLGRRDVFPADSYKSSHGLDLHFGLGKHSTVTAEVLLPDGTGLTFPNIPIRNVVTLDLSTGKSKAIFTAGNRRSRFLDRRQERNLF